MSSGIEIINGPEKGQIRRASPVARTNSQDAVLEFVLENQQRVLLWVNGINAADRLATNLLLNGWLVRHTSFNPHHRQLTDFCTAVYSTESRTGVWHELGSTDEANLHYLHDRSKRLMIVVADLDKLWVSLDDAKQFAKPRGWSKEMAATAFRGLHRHAHGKRPKPYKVRKLRGAPWVKIELRSAVGYLGRVNLACVEGVGEGSFAFLEEWLRFIDKNPSDF